MALSTIQDYIRYAVSLFNRSSIYYGHGNNNSIDEATQLILGSLDLPMPIPQEFYACNLTDEERAQIEVNLKLRVENRIPTAYIVNSAQFCGHEFYVDERVLIPRSPMADMIKRQFDNIIVKPPENILDLCSGSGCIGIACAYEFPNTEIDLADISPDALAVAEINIQAHHLNNRVFPICSDLFHDLPDIQYDIIITNPPYVDEEDMLDLPQEYSSEPKMALASGKDGLDITSRILKEAAQYLSDTGVLICEVGNSLIALQKKYPDVPFHWIEFDNDCDGVFWLTKAELTIYQTHF